MPVTNDSNGQETSYARRLRDLANIDLEEESAEELLRDIGRHRRTLFHDLGRDVGQRVALVDYLLNVRPQQIDPAIVESRTLSTIRRDAITDALTGLYNRHYFEDVLRREAERCLRHDLACSLLLLDMDGFKAINDRRGHRAGDLVLATVARVVFETVRATDTPCRYGGDEFAIILSDTPQAEALVVAERTRAAVERELADMETCISGGLATLPTNAASAEELFILADGALYEAKNLGANQIVAARAYSPPPCTGSRADGRRNGAAS